MTLAPTATLKPMFKFGGRGDGAPLLVVVAGGLILDLGEAERTFIFRCQDRFLAYTSLWGLHSVFFAASDRHVAIYRQQIATQRARYDRIRERTGLFAHSPLIEPLYVGCDIDQLRLFALSDFAEQTKDLPPSFDLATNQISPTYATLLTQLAGLLRSQGAGIELAGAASASLAELAKACADKSNYLALARSEPVLPCHVPTALLSAAELGALGDYRSLATAYACKVGGDVAVPERLFVKATLNSSGNLSARVGESNFAGEMRRLCATLAREAAMDGVALERQVEELRQEVDVAPCLRPLDLPAEQLRHFKRNQAALRQRVDFLVQAEVRRRDDDVGFGGIGLSYVLDDDTITPIGATAQLYRDSDHKHFQGAFLCDAIDRDIAPAFHAAMGELCHRYAALGYRGPINFDARRDGLGQYQLIYDCNPRLTGVLASLVVRDALRSGGAPIQSVLTLGYRGEFVLPDIEGALDRLERAQLLFTKDRPRGAVLIPNLCREDGFDLHLANIDPGAANRLLSGELGALSTSTVHPERLYW